MSGRSARGTRVAVARPVVAIKKLGHDAVTSVEIAWHVPPPPPRTPAAHTLAPPRRVPIATPARPGVLATGVPPMPPRVFATGTVTNAKPGGAPSMTALTSLAKAIASESSFERAAVRLQNEACRLARAAEALCVVFDWPRRAAWTVQGPIANESVKELVAQVAGSGHRSIIGNALLEPIGPAPSRAVLALRKPTGATFSVQEIAMISTLALGLATSIDRLIQR